MALDPRITLGLKTTDVGSVFNNALLNVSNLNKLQQQQAEAPIRQQMLEIGLSSAQNQQQQTQQQQNLVAGIANSQELVDFIQTGDLAGARENLGDLREQLQASGQPTDRADQAMQLLETNPELLLQRATNSIAQGKQQLGGFDPTASAASEAVQSSQILGDGSTIQILRNGDRRVTNPQGEVVTGQGAADIIKTARDEEARQQAARAGSRAQAVSDVAVDELLTLEDVSAAIKQGIELDKLKIDETKFKNEEDRKLKTDTKNIRRKEAENALSVVGELLTDDRFSSAFGKLVTATPELLRSQDAIDSRAQVDQIVGLISLEARQKLRGSGTITDSEQKTLQQSATILANPLISDDIARKELRKIRNVFEDAADRNKLIAPEQPAQVGRFTIEVEG